MLTALICLAGLAASPAPTLPAGTHAEFQRLYGEVVQASASGDFAKAEKLTKLLPKSEIVFQWDDSKVPANLRAEYAEARERAFEQWRKFVPGFTFKAGAKPDIRFTFEPKLVPLAGSKEAPAAVHFFGFSPEEPRLEAVIALERGDPPLLAEMVDVHNEVAYGLAQYLGLARTPNFGGYSTRTEASTALLVRPSPTEMALSKLVVQICDLVRGTISRSQAMSWSPAKAEIDKEFFDLGTIPQGEIRQFSYQLNNVGKGILHVTMIPDCGCLAQPRIEPLNAGQSKLVPLAVDTTNFVGEQHKAVLVYTNDPEKPVREIKIRLNITPAYRFLVPDGDIIEVDANGGVREVFLSLPKDSDIAPQDYRVDGLPASVTLEKWSGELPDPELNEPKMPREGYRLLVKVEPGVYIGRNMVTLVLTTKSKLHPILRLPLSVQSGIVALPEVLNLGQISRAPKRANFLVASSGQDFDILGVTSENPHLSFTHKPTRGKWEHRITVQYDGKAPDLRLETAIKVRTSSPKTPVVTVQLRAVQR